MGEDDELRFRKLHLKDLNVLIFEKTLAFISYSYIHSFVYSFIVYGALCMLQAV